MPAVRVYAYVCPKCGEEFAAKEDHDGEPCELNLSGYCAAAEALRAIVAQLLRTDGLQV